MTRVAQGKIPVKYPTVPEKRAMNTRESYRKGEEVNTLPSKLTNGDIQHDIHSKSQRYPHKVFHFPRKPTTIDSETKRNLMSRGEAPMVRIIPISLVRSKSVTVIVLNIPMADTRVRYRRM